MILTDRMHMYFSSSSSSSDSESDVESSSSSGSDNTSKKKESDLEYNISKKKEYTLLKILGLPKRPGICRCFVKILLFLHMIQRGSFRMGFTMNTLAIHPLLR